MTLPTAMARYTGVVFSVVADLTDPPTDMGIKEVIVSLRDVDSTATQVVRQHKGSNGSYLYNLAARGLLTIGACVSVMCDDDGGVDLVQLQKPAADSGDGSGMVITTPDYMTQLLQRSSPSSQATLAASQGTPGSSKRTRCADSACSNWLHTCLP
jgi:hypothetical protein